MNKDKLLMVILIIATLLFFNSPVWQNGIGAKIKPAPVVDSTKLAVKPVVNNSESKELPPTVDSSNAKDTLLTNSSDTVAEVVPTTYDTVVIENKLLKLTVAGDGARIISAIAKDYSYAKKFNLPNKKVELIHDKDNGIGGFSIAGKSIDKLPFTLVSKENNRYVFETTVNGQKVEKVYSISDSSYVVGFEVNSPLLNGKDGTLKFASGISESETLDGLGLRYAPRQVDFYNGKKIKKRTYSKPISERYNQNISWVALTSRYFTLVALPSLSQNVELITNGATIDRFKKSNPANIIYTFDITAPARGDKVNYDFYIGPTKISDLKAVHANLEKLLFRGYGWFFAANLWFPKLCEFVLFLMNFFFSIFHDYGIAIILITVILRLITFPLTQSSMKSMSKMKELQPKLQRVQEKYKNNPQLMQAKLMELYKEEGVSPLSGLGGCLPMFLQMPIMISLYVVLRKAVELRGQSTVLLPWVHDLAQKEALVNLPFTIPIVNISTIAVLPILMAVLMFFQNKMTMQNANSDDPNQKMMLYMMPLMMFFMFYNMPAGLTLYFTFSSVFQLVQQFFVEKAKKKNESSVTVVK